MTTPAVTPFRAGRTSGIQPQAAGPLFAGAYTLLADCSEFQPDIADLTYLKWSKAIVIRAAYGDAHDDAAWYGGARRADLHAGGAAFLGIYQYLVSGQDGAAQADALHGLAGGLQKGEVLIADFEQGQKAMLTAWYNRMTALGYPAEYLWTYTGLDFGQSAGALPVQWLADYSTMEPSSAHRLWQFTETYPVPGVGTADCSVFHGTVAELAALAYPGTTAPAQPAQHLTPAPGSPRQALKSAGTVGTFTWDPVAGQTSYHLQVEWYKPGFGWVLSVDSRVGTPSDTIALAAQTKYRWRVAAGTAGYTWTSWTEFTTP